MREHARRALGKPPRVVARRLLAEASVELERVRAPLRARRLDARSLLHAAGADSLGDLWERVVVRAPFPEGTAPPGEEERPRVLAAAEHALARRVDLLGSGPVELGRPIDWLRDPKTGQRWPPGYAPRLDYGRLGRPGDVKLPWEISRVQWLLPAGQAYLLTGEERYATAARDVLDEWIAANPYAGTVNWSVTMEVALRILSWSWLLGALGHSAAWADEGFRNRFLCALWLHGDYASRHLERSDVNGNHLTAGAAGLTVAGLLFGHGPWAKEGWRLLVQELPLQVHEDGVDFEASAAYHRLVGELFLLPALYREQLGLPVPATYRSRLEAMGRFTLAITGPDGLAPLWGDADDARALPLDGRPPRDHRGLPELLGLEPGPAVSAAFPHGGVYVLASGDDHVVVDCGPVGLAGRGGHGHNDCLSFEATLMGVRLVTDCGSFVYTADPVERNRFRATAAHNTPLVDGTEQNRIPASLWHLCDDARGEALAVGGLRITGTHHGYERLSDPVRVARTIALEPGAHRLTVEDELTAREAHDVRVPFHLAPGITAAPEAGGSLLLTAADGSRFRLRWEPTADWTCELGEAWQSPSYGVRVSIVRVELCRDGPLRPLRVVLEPA